MPPEVLDILSKMVPLVLAKRFFILAPYSWQSNWLMHGENVLKSYPPPVNMSAAYVATAKLRAPTSFIP